MRGQPTIVSDCIERNEVDINDLYDFYGISMHDRHYTDTRDWEKSYIEMRPGGDIEEHWESNEVGNHNSEFDTHKKWGEIETQADWNALGFENGWNGWVISYINTYGCEGG